MIRHTVVFKLKHAAGSAAERSFLRSAQELAQIPVVKNFECLRQVSKKNHYDFALSMEFNSADEYRIYNSHADHVRFVEKYWNAEVLDFMEIDYEPIVIDESLRGGSDQA